MGGNFFYQDQFQPEIEVQMDMSESPNVKMNLHNQWHLARMEDCHLISIISTKIQKRSFSLFH